MTTARLTSRRPHDPLAFRGRVDMHTVESVVLAGNPLGDPHVRELPVYVPPMFEAGRDELAVVFLLAGFTGRGQGYLETHPWREGVVARFDRAVAAGETPPAVLVLPDAFTRLGGSQYVNSDAVGNYADHLTDELVPLVVDHYGVAGAPRAVIGKSSGGFGALHLCMHHPGVFQACVSISGDCGFDNLFPPEFLACARGLLAWGSDAQRFLEAFCETPDLSGDGHAVLNTLAMAACYSPNRGSSLGFDLPFDPETGERIEAVWQRWLAFDPLVAVEDRHQALHALRFLQIECGLADEFHLQWGARRLARRLTELGVPHRHEEHTGGHRGIDERFLLALDRVTRAFG